jgi:hypothetical protein
VPLPPTRPDHYYLVEGVTLIRLRLLCHRLMARINDDRPMTRDELLVQLHEICNLVPSDPPEAF